MLKWTSESEYFLSFENIFAESKSNHLTLLLRGVITGVVFGVMTQTRHKFSEFQRGKSVRTGI